jgi:hypothetical protein
MLVLAGASAAATFSGIWSDLLTATTRCFGRSRPSGRAALSEVETLTVEVERTWTPDELIGMAYSTSQASPERLVKRQLEFERRVRQELKPGYHEWVPVDAVIGRQPLG